MANIFLNLPMPAGDGAGASVDTSAMGKEKSIVIGGEFEGVNVSVEASTDGVEFQSVASFRSAGKQVIEVAAQFMRVSVVGRSGLAFSAEADIGANDSGALFFSLPVPAADGAGAPVDVSTLGNFTTFVVGGDFQGVNVTVQISEDGTNYADCASFVAQAGIVSKVLVANWMRTFVTGHDGNALPFTPVVSVGATVDAGGGGGGALTSPHIIQTGDGTASGPADASVVIAHGVANGGTADVQVSADASGFAMGEVQSDAVGGNTYVKNDSRGGFAGGFAHSASLGSAFIKSGGLGVGEEGAFAFGSADHKGASGNASIRATQRGAFATGHASINALGTGAADIYASGPGAFATGHVYGFGAGQGRIYAGAGGFARGSALGYGTNSLGQIRATGAAASAQGFANGGSGLNSDADIRASGDASSAQGFAKINDGVGIAQIHASAQGSRASGYCLGRAAYFTGNSSILARSKGAFAHGAADGGLMDSYGQGSVALGAALFGGRIAAEQNGALAFGYAYYPSGEIRSDGLGSFAGGSTYNALSSVRSLGSGSFAMGRVEGGSVLQSSGTGSHAGGFAASYNITASASGSFAFGNANTGAIVANAQNAVQFGPGSNAQTDSLQVGNAGLRLKGTVAAPGVLQNGDMWVAGTNVYIRTGGVTKNISTLT